MDSSILLDGHRIEISSPNYVHATIDAINQEITNVLFVLSQGNWEFNKKTVQHEN